MAAPWAVRDPADAAALTALLEDPEFVHPSPYVVGPPQWECIHNLARTYQPTPEKMAAVKAYVQAIGVLFPCSKCAPEWTKLAATVDTSSRQNFLAWTIWAHNQVNARVGAKVYSVQEAVAAMRGGRRGGAPLTAATGAGPTAPGGTPSNGPSAPSGRPKYYTAALVVMGIVTAVALAAAVGVGVTARRRRQTRRPPPGGEGIAK